MAVLTVVGVILVCACIIVFGLVGCALALTDKICDDSDDQDVKK